MTSEPIIGPASYFPSIEKKYGRPIAEWIAEVRKRYPAKHMELVAMLKMSTKWVTATPMRSSPTPWLRTTAKHDR